MLKGVGCRCIVFGKGPKKYIFSITVAMNTVILRVLLHLKNWHVKYRIVMHNPKRVISSDTRPGTGFVLDVFFPRVYLGLLHSITLELKDIHSSSFLNTLVCGIGVC